MSRHLWYVHPSTVVLALLDDRVSVQERQDLASAIADTDRPASFSIAKPQSCGLDVCEGAIPSLPELVSPRSWFLFELLDLRGEAVEWLKKDLAH